MISITPERLAAYADGELDGETARAVETAIAADPALQAQVAAHRALKARLSAHFAPIAAQPVQLFRELTEHRNVLGVVDVRSVEPDPAHAGVVHDFEHIGHDRSSVGVDLRSP